MVPAEFCNKRSLCTIYVLASCAALLIGQTDHKASAQLSVSPVYDSVLDSNALVLATGGNFSHIINGSPFQQEVLLTHDGYQYASWYHNGANQDIYVSRRNLNGNTWETIDTGYNMQNGNTNWDSHNVISMGISGDGRIHLSYDHHVDTLRYLTTDPGVATSAGGTWNQTIFKSERSALNQGGSTVSSVSYPRFANVGDDLVLTYRERGSGNGDVRIADYDAQTGQWSSTRFVNKGAAGSGTYDDVNNNPSTKRNAYHNGFHADSTGRLHTSWTWRESTQDGNHDINYAYSDDKGVTWRNNDGQLVGTNSSPITLNSTGIEIVDLDRHQAIINQQGQIVDAEGGVHILMYHRRQEPGFEWQTGDGIFSKADSAYHHYYRDPSTGDWDVSLLPTNIPVGNRPRLGVDGHGNLFGLYTLGDDLVIAGAEKNSAGEYDWQTLYRDQSRNYEGTPQIDTQRLFSDGILSVYLQEEATSNSATTPSGSSLHVLDFATITPQTPYSWIGGQSGTWQQGGAINWDTTANNTSNAAFVNGRQARFTDNATRFNVYLSGSVRPSETIFTNTTNDYVLSGAPLAGDGGLQVTGGGRVQLQNGANTYTGPTEVENGTLALASGTAISASSSIRVGVNGVLEPTGTLNLAGQPLDLAGEINGNLNVSGGATVEGTGRVTGNLNASDGLLRVGVAGVFVTSGPTTTLIDDFSTTSLSDYTETRILDLGTTDNVSFASQGGRLRTVSSGTDGAEQTLLLRSDYGLSVGQELQVDADIVVEGGREFGIVVAADEAPTQRRDYAFVAIAEAANMVRARGVDGTTALNLVSDSSASIKDALFIARLDENTFEVGYYVGTQRSVMATRSMGNGDVGSAIGFYSDLRADGTINGLDNFRIYDPDFVAAVGETLTIDGDLTLSSASTLELGIFGPDISDLLAVGGAFNAAGELRITLDPMADPLQPGDEFDIFDFGSFSGAFDTLDLPVLEAGLYWNTAGLMNSGLLAVIDMLPGDYDNNGIVDAADFTVWRDGNSPDSSYSGYLQWRSNFGATATSPVTAIPEPNVRFLPGLGIAIALGRRGKRQSRSHCPEGENCPV